MANRFIIGKGELLTYDIPPPPMLSKKAHPYSLDEAKSVVIPQMQQAVVNLRKLPSAACPHDFAVAKLQLHPAYISKSFFPKALLREAGLVSIGSRTTRTSPRCDLRIKAPEECDTTELFVAGTRAALARLPALAQGLNDGTTSALQLRQIEQFQSMEASDRVRSIDGPPGSVFEVGLHLIPDQPPETLRKAFAAYAGLCGFRSTLNMSFQLGECYSWPSKAMRPACRFWRNSHSCASFDRCPKSVAHAQCHGRPQLLLVLTCQLQHHCRASRR